jgi:hypothetical protein
VCIQAKVTENNKQRDRWVTVAQKGTKQSTPLIVWKTTYFGDDYPPDQRCKEVSGKLAKAVADNKGSLQNLKLTHGIVNKSTVICYVKGTGKCDGTNQLFTLKPENAPRAAAIIKDIGRFAAGQANVAPLVEAGSNTQEYADLGEMLNPVLGADESQPSTPSNSSDSNSQGGSPDNQQGGW